MAFWQCAFTHCGMIRTISDRPYSRPSRATIQHLWMSSISMPLSLLVNQFYHTRAKPQPFNPQVEAISSLHAMGIVHRDIQPSWIFLDEGGHLILSGFDHVTFVCGGPAGCSCHDVTKAQRNDTSYRSPELLLGWKHDAKVDIWSFGVLLFEMLTGKVRMYIFVAPLLLICSRVPSQLVSTSLKLRHVIVEMRRISLCMRHCNLSPCRV